MILIHVKTGLPVKVGDILRERFSSSPTRYTVAGWDPRTTFVHVWADPKQVGDMRHQQPWSVHWLGCEWRTE